MLSFICIQIMGKPIEMFPKQYQEVLSQEEDGENEENEEMDVDDDD